MSKAHANRAEDRTGELKQLNRSIFRPVIVFNKDAKRAAAEAKIQARHDEERDERERTMAGVRESQNRVGRAAGYGRGDEDDEEGLGGGGRRDRSAAAQGAREKARGRYQFEKTASDDELEDELDDNLDEILDVSKRLKVLAMAAGNEVTAQNGQLDKLGDKVSSVDSKVSRNTNAVSSTGCFSLSPD